MRLHTAIALFAVISSAPSRGQDSSTFTYQFNTAAEFADFEVVQGRWSNYAGALSCTSKGREDEIQWRRELAGEARVEIEVLSNGACAVVLRGTDGAVTVTVTKSAGEFEVRNGDVLVKKGLFDKKARDSATLGVDLIGGVLSVRIGSDEVLKSPLARFPKVTRLSLLSLRSQARFGGLKIERPGSASTDPATPSGLGEEQRLLLNRAEQLMLDKEWENALTVLSELVPADKDPEDWRAKMPPVALIQLNRIALHLPKRLLRKAPLDELLAQTLVIASDGSMACNLPFRVQWTAKTPRLRRTDGVLVEVSCSSPPVEVRFYRYDQQHQYWFGREPKLKYVGGSSTHSLAKARFEDQVEELDSAVVRREPSESRWPLRHRGTFESELSYIHRDNEQDEGREMVVREFFFPLAGHTVRATITATSDTWPVVEDEIQWLISSVQRYKDGRPR